MMKKLISVGMVILLIGGVYLMIPSSEITTSVGSSRINENTDQRNISSNDTQPEMAPLEETKDSAPTDSQSIPELSPEVEEALNEAANEILGQASDDIEQAHDSERLPLADI